MSDEEYYCGVIRIPETARKTIRVSKIIKKYLRENGFDGLCNLSEECGCGIDDLVPCDSNPSECEPAYKTMGVDGPIYGPKKEQP